MDDILESDTNDNGEAGLRLASTSSLPVEASARQIHGPSAVLPAYPSATNSTSQLLSQSLLSPRIRIEEARQFNDELVEQDPGSQCDSLRDLGQIVDDTLDSLEKQVRHILKTSEYCAA
jgi:hypothetical protein